MHSLGDSCAMYIGGKINVGYQLRGSLGHNCEVARLTGTAEGGVGGPLTGGSRFHMSILRKGNVALSNLRNTHVTLSI